MSSIDQFLLEMVQAGGSDLHIPSGSPPKIRVHGQLETLQYPPFEAEEVGRMAQEILGEQDTQILLEDSNVDFVYDIPVPCAMKRFRANAFVQKNGLNLVFRGIPGKIPSLADLGMPEILKTLTHHHHGLALVVGPAGCGKTSTLAAMIQYVNESRASHIISVEEPIEYIFENQRSLIIQRQVGTHVDKFSTALRAALREDPDVVVVAEMRDLETIAMAISAAETGHLVLGTLHTRSAIQTVQRIIDSFPTNQQSQIRTMLSESLRGVCSQQLVPRADGTGRVVAYELLLINTSVANLIREGKDFQLPNVMQMGKSKGMKMMDDSLKELHQQGIITADTAVVQANDPKNMTEYFKGIGVALQ